MKWIYRCIIMIMVGCVPDEEPLIMKEFISTEFTCVNSTASTVCTHTSKLLIPTYLNIGDKKLRKVEIDSLHLVMQSNNPIDIRLDNMIITYRSTNEVLFNQPMEVQNLMPGVVEKRNLLQDSLKLRLTAALLKDKEVLVTTGLTTYPKVELLTIRFKLQLTTYYD